MTTIKKDDILKTAQSMDTLWSPLTDEQRQLLTDHIDVRRYKKYDIIFHEGDKPDHLYCLLKGRVKIYKLGVGGRQQIVHMPPLKGFFGYSDGFIADRYTTEAAAVEAVTLCAIPLSVIKHLILHNNTIAVFFIRQLANLLGFTAENMVSLTQKHLRGRLADALLHLKEYYGTEDNGQTLATSLIREDLANLSNMTTSNAIRTLSAFADEGLISIEGRKISIMDEPLLRQVSQIG